MAVQTHTTVVAAFEDLHAAREAVRELHAAGFRDDQIGIIAHDRDTGDVDRTTDDQGNKAGEGAVTGALAGAGVGGLWAIGISAGLLPAIGPIIAGGLLASVLASAAGGAAAGGLLGALVGMGIPEEEARFYEGEFQSGRTIVTVRAQDRYDEAFGILNRWGGYDINAGRSQVEDPNRPIVKPR